MDGDYTVHKTAGWGNQNKGPEYSVGPYGKTIKLIDSVASTAATGGAYIGPWCDVSTLKSINVTVDGVFTGTANIEGTNLPDPQPGDSGHSLCTAPTASGLVALTAPIRAVRVRMSGFSSGSLTVTACGVA